MRKLVYCLAGLICSFSSIAAVPATPENLQPAWLFGAVRLTWDPVPEAAGYNVYSYDTNNAIWVQKAANLDVPRYHESSVDVPTIYSVTAVNADGESPPAGPVLAEQTGDSFAISADQRMWTIYDTVAIIQWTVDIADGADGTLEVGTSPTNLTSFAWDTNYATLHRLTVTNLVPGTYYVGRITSVASNHTGVETWIYFNTLAVNHPPVTQDQSYDIYEDPNGFLPVTIGAWDPDWHPVTISIVSGPLHGTLFQSNAWWSYYYLPETNWFGNETISFVASDGMLTSSPGTIRINVWSMDDPPVPIDQTVTTVEDTPLTISMQAIDVENDPITSVQIVSGLTNGWAWTSGSNVTYYPYPNVNGDDSFTFRVCDAGGACSWITGTIVIHILPGNDPPVAQDVYMSAHAGAPCLSSFAVSDLDGDTLTGEIVSGPANGTVTIDGTNFTYTANPGMAYFNDSFFYRASDGQTNSSPAMVWIWVGGTNTVPVAQDQNVVAIQNKNNTFQLDVVDPDGDLLRALVLTGPTNGTLQFYGINVIYHPATNYLGPDSFSYQIWDGTATGNVATVSIDVIPNRPPVADSVSYSLPEEYTIDFTLTAADPDGDALTFVILTPPAHGSLYPVIFQYPLTSTPGQYQYTGAPNYNGPDSFTFTVNDGLTNGNVATVNINVTPINDQPVANAQSVAVVEDTPKSITLTASDADNDPLTYIVVSSPAHGTLTGAGANRVYTPATNYTGSDSFTFKVNDGSVDSTVKTVSLSVSAVNDPPVAFGQTVTVNEDSFITITLTSFDPDGPATNYIVTAQPAHGTLTVLNPPLGTIRKYTPATNYNGSDSFTFKVNDGTVDGNTATVAITVAPVNDPPVASPQSVTTAEDVPITITLGGSDLDGDLLNFIIVAAPAHGTLSGSGASRVYTPATNYNGSDSFTFKVNDGTVNGNTATVTITVTAVNDPPIANPQSVSTAEDTALNITLTGSDADGEAITFAILTGPAHGVLSGSGQNRVYTPNANFNGTDSFVFKVTDIQSNSGTATVTITVTPVNDAPIASSQSLSTPEDSPLSVTLAGSDVDGDPLSFLVVSGPAHGTLAGTGANRTYTPASNYNGPDSFTFKVNDGSVDGNTATVTITVTSVNDAPVADAQSVTTAEDTALNITLTGSDVDGDSLSFTVVSAPAHGTLSGVGANRVYTPATDYNGSDSFTFKVNDGSVDGNTATVTITVTPVNDPPTANSQSLTTAEDTTLNITLTGSDPDGDVLNFTVLSGPSNGMLSGLGENLVYTPNANFNGTDTFVFAASDSSTNSPAASVTITVTPVNDAPVANSQSVTTAEDTALNITLTGSDVDGDTLSFTVVSAPLHGTLSGVGANRVYTPATNYNGSDSFTFKANDGTVDGNTATVTITVTSVNDAPVADAQSVTTAEDTALNITLTGSDPEDDPLSFAIVTGPTHGMLSGSGENLVYTPNLNFNGTDTFLFAISDPFTNGATATVTITVTPVNDAPISNPQSVTTAEDTALNITLTGSDVDGDTLSFNVVSAPAHGTLSGVGANRVYTPAADYNGSDSFTFKSNDGTVDGNTAAVTIMVTAVNDSPIANSQSVTTAEDTPLNITLTGADVDGDTLSFTVVSGPAHGTLSGVGANRVYTPPADYNGSDSFTFKVNDGTVDGNTATVTITITAVNDAPIANSQSVTTTEDTPLDITLTGSDVDGDTLSFIVVTGPGHGTLSGTGANRVYNPTANYNGSDSFTFKANDGTIAGNTATVTITVTAVNDAPVANSQSVSTAEDTALNLTLTGSDVDGDALSFAIVNTPAHGTLSGVGANRTYTPAANYNGSDSFTFKVNDGTVDGNTATVTITVTAVNDAPVANSQSVSTAEDTALNITLTGSDVEGDPLSFIIVTAPAHGTLSGTGANRTYTPASNYSGPDSFTFKVNDGTVDGSTATVSISITAVNDPPVANGQSVSTPYNAPVNITLTGSDPEGSVLTYVVLSNPANGTLSGSGPNCTFTPNTGWSGTTTFMFKVNDGALDSASATVTITVAGPGSIPAAPTGLIATAISKTQINLAWNDNSSNEDGFQIERSLNGTSWTQIAVVGMNVLTYSNTGLAANKLYYYRVRAYNVLGNSAYSNTASAKTLH